MIADISLWLMWCMTMMLCVLIYLRVDRHDWGMVGMDIFFFGTAVLLTRALFHRYGLYTHPDIVWVWRVLVIVGAPIALTGHGVGFFRDKPAPQQVVKRLIILIGVVVFVSLAIVISD